MLKRGENKAFHTLEWSVPIAIGKIHIYFNTRFTHSSTYYFIK